MNTNEMREKSRVIFMALRRIQNLIKCKHPDIGDLTIFRMKLTDIQEKIQNLRIQSKITLEVLKKKEKSLNEELEYYNQMSPECRDVNISKNQTCNLQTKISDKYTEPYICYEVKEFIDFVSVSGHDDGWLDRDHQLFLKFRNKYKNMNSIIEKLQAILPDLSEEKIRNHNKWYEKYTELYNKKKEAIKRWKRTKESRKQEDEIREAQEPKLKKTMPIQKDNIMEDRIVKWKTEKAEKIKQQMENARILKEIQQDREKENEARQKQLRSVVEEWKRRRKINTELVNLEQKTIEFRRKQVTKKEATKLIKQFRKRDWIYIKRMQNAHKKCETNQLKFQKTTLSDVRSKLFEPTAQWLNRIGKNEEQIIDLKVDNYVKYIPKLHIPEWRKALVT